MCLFSNRLQMMSQCGKNKKVAHEPQTHFDVFCDLLLNRHTVTCSLFVYNNEEKKVANDDVIDMSVL